MNIELCKSFSQMKSGNSRHDKIFIKWLLPYLIKKRRRKLLKFIKIEEKYPTGQQTQRQMFENCFVVPICMSNQNKIGDSPTTSIGLFHHSSASYRRCHRAQHHATFDWYFLRDVFYVEYSEPLLDFAC